MQECNKNTFLVTKLPCCSQTDRMDSVWWSGGGCGDDGDDGDDGDVGSNGIDAEGYTDAFLCYSSDKVSRYCTIMTSSHGTLCRCVTTHEMLSSTSALLNYIIGGFTKALHQWDLWEQKKTTIPYVHCESSMCEYWGHEDIITYCAIQRQDMDRKVSVFPMCCLDGCFQYCAL